MYDRIAYKASLCRYFCVTALDYGIKMKKKQVVLNLIISTATELVTLVLGLVLPRLILVSWGSEYNGLLSSVTNILRYMALLEAGFRTSAIQALYKTIGEGDLEKTSIVVRTSQQYYRRISLTYLTIVCLIAVLYPLIIKTDIPFIEVFLIILLQGSVGIINFAFRSSYQQLLSAEGKYYVISLIGLITTILTYTSKIIAIRLFNNVIIMQFMGVIVIIIQVVIYALYFNNKYSWIDKNAAVDDSLLLNRKYYVTQQIAGLIFNSTDTFVLSFFCGLKVASVYAVYNLVYSALAQIMLLIRSSTGFVLGQSYHKGKLLFKKIYSVYSSMQTIVGGIMASISIILIMGFIRIYTDGITDINYLDFAAAFLFSFNLILECSRGASLAAANIAGRAPETTGHYIMEAAINLCTSLVLVQFLGMRGVLLGTAIAGLYRTTDSIVYTNKKVLVQSPLSEAKMVITSFLLYFMFAYLGYSVIKIDCTNYLELLIKSLQVGVVVVIVYGIAYIIINYNWIKSVLRDFFIRIKEQ